jgi:alginate O-acetyltransferase complex protein AlgI
VLFPTVDYLLFLPLVVALYWLAPKQARLAVLGIASLAFYASWRVSYLPVLFFVIGVAWLGSLWLKARIDAAASLRGPRVVAVGLLLLPLLYFKYWDWLSGDVQALLGRYGVELELDQVGLALPIGISFFTFQAIAWVVDVGRGAKTERNLWRFGTFITFFPQLVAGPIVRGEQLLPQLRTLPMLARGQVGAGLFRISRGLVKKLLVADVLRVGMVDPMFADPGKFTGLELAVGLYAYTLQIYCDFSGYTDMAIGSARLFGFELPENFRRPYKAITITDYWRRWHITLSLWVRHYIYFPLGGARSPWAVMVYVNLFVTFLVIGVWHGASWNFVVYGAIHATAMCIQRALRKRHGRDPAEAPPGFWPYAWRFLLTFHFVVVARILFRAEDFAGSWAYVQGLTDPGWVMPRFAWLAWFMLIGGFAVHWTPESWQERAEAWWKEAHPAAIAAALAAVAIACATLGTGEQLSFIYYDF